MRILPRQARWRYGVLLALGLGAWLVHVPVFRWAARALIVAEPVAEVNYLVVRGTERGVEGYNGFGAAADFYRQDRSRRILLIPHRGGRLVELGVLKPFAALARLELTSPPRNVPEAALTVADGVPADTWEEAGALRDWLEAHPGVTVALMVNPLSSRRLRYIVDSSLPAPDARRVRILVLGDPGKTCSGWWKTRSGVKGFMQAWLEMAYTWCQGPHRRVPAQQGVADYQEIVRKAFAKSP